MVSNETFFSELTIIVWKNNFEFKTELSGTEQFWLLGKVISKQVSSSLIFYWFSNLWGDEASDAMEMLLMQ